MRLCVSEMEGREWRQFLTSWKLQKCFDFSKTFRLSKQTDDQNNIYSVANEEHREFITDIFMKKPETSKKKKKKKKRMPNKQSWKLEVSGEVPSSSAIIWALDPNGVKQFKARNPKTKTVKILKLEMTNSIFERKVLSFITVVEQKGKQSRI